jgi:hypothetical protein
MRREDLVRTCSFLLKKGGLTTTNVPVIHVKTGRIDIGRSLDR